MEFYFDGSQKSKLIKKNYSKPIAVIVLYLAKFENVKL